MPIDKNDFERGIDDEVKKILTFLSNARDKAFTSKEIAEALKLDVGDARLILGYIKETGFVKTRDIGAYRYYIFQRMP